MLSSVDFPQPEGPIKATSSPSPTVKEISLKIVLVPNFFVTFLIQQHLQRSYYSLSLKAISTFLFHYASYILQKLLLVSQTP